MSSMQARNVNHPEHVENLNSQKYTLIREAMLAALPALSSGQSLSFAELETRVEAWLREQEVPRALFPRPGSVRWYTKAVQLDLEARGEIERIPGETPLRLRRAG